MPLNHVEGKGRGRIVLYALSTCVWCRKAKKLLGELGVDYYFVDVDLLEGEEEKEQVVNQIKKWNASVSFPTLVISDEKCIKGFDESKIREELG